MDFFSILRECRKNLRKQNALNVTPLNQKGLFIKIETLSWYFVHKGHLDL